MTNRKTLNQARREFQAKYGDRSTQVVSLLVRGFTTEQVASRTGASVASVRTTRGNLTRGAYSPFVSVVGGKFRGRLVAAR